MARELLANREAQPVELHMGVAMEVFDTLRDAMLSSRVEHSELGAMGATKIEVWSSKIGVFLEMHQANGGCTLKVFTAQPAPAVPDEITAPLGAIANGYQLSIAQAEGYRWGWNACRAAMLAQPVSQVGKLPDSCKWTYDEHDYKWDSGCGEAWMFSDGGPTENGVKFCQGCGKPVLLAAAPEGGSDPDTRR